MDPDPDPLQFDTNEFFFPGSGLSALLIHGLSGTPYEMRAVGKRLAAAGVRVHGVKLAGHAGAPEELGATTHANWYESVVDGFERLRAYGDPNVIVGLSAGAVLAARLAVDQPEAVAGLVMLAPAFYLPFWTRTALRAVSGTSSLAGLAKRIYIQKTGGSDIHDAIARKLHPGGGLMPLSAGLSLVELCDYMRPRLPELNQPTLVIHSRRDHTCPCETNVRLLMNHLGSTQKRALILEESFHVITVDSEKDRVEQETLEFIDQFRHASEPARAMNE
jgi:carboxylesterase